MELGGKKYKKIINKNKIEYREGFEYEYIIMCVRLQLTICSHLDYFSLSLSIFYAELIQGLEIIINIEP